jgi:cytochrome c oxidase cbb3-type subunit 3
MSKKEVDDVSGTETTGHEWDGIKELNTPLPRWWLGILYASIVWAIGYWIVYPAWPTLSGYTPGLLNHSQRDEVMSDVAALESARAGQEQELANSSLTEIQRNPDMLQFAMAAGRAAFGDNCVPCHGAGGQGARGYPTMVSGCGAASSPTSSTQSRLACVRPIPARGSPRCRPLAGMAFSNPNRLMI